MNLLLKKLAIYLANKTGGICLFGNENLLSGREEFEIVQVTVIQTVNEGTRVEITAIEKNFNLNYIKIHR